MPPTTSSPLASGWRRTSGLVLPIIIIGAILVFVIPIPPGLLDVLLSANLTLAVMVLLTTLAIRTPQESPQLFACAVPVDEEHDA